MIARSVVYQEQIAAIDCREVGGAAVNLLLAAFVDRRAERRGAVIDILYGPVIDRYVVGPAVIFDFNTSPECRTMGAVLSGGIV